MRSRPLLVLATCFASLTSFAQVSHAKPRLVVLGLEVTGDSAMDQKATEAAKALTRELRREANRPGGPYELASNGNKDLLEMKLLSDCSDEARRCMSEIGKQLKADRLAYGRLERTKRGYSVSLRLLDTDSSEQVKQLSELIPFSDVSAAGGLQRRARSLYGRLTGADDEGAIAITATTDSGTVYVDGKIRTSLSAGSARVSGLSDGVHTVAIESPGYARYEAEVNVDSGAVAELNASLVEVGGEGGGDEQGDERPGGGWRIAFWSGVLATGVAGAGWTYSGLSVRSAEKDVQNASAEYRGPELTPAPVDGSYESACKSFGSDAAMSNPELRAKVLDACDRGDKQQNLVNWVWIPATATAALFASYAYYKGYIAPRRMSAEREARRRGKRGNRVTVTPALGPNLVGAGLELTF
ncbi:MAG TPA: PEGA domain-containing protein [Kofleriaceae bacterium]|nr:PEGA domain-containing protein [Kofleriaceae bacterium]